MPAQLTATTLAGRANVAGASPAGMTSPGGGAALVPDTSAGVPDQRDAALAAARQLLAETVEAVNPATPARDLLACLTRYGARLSAIIAARSVPGSGE